MSNGADIGWLDDFSLGGQASLVRDRLSIADALIKLDGITARGTRVAGHRDRRFDLALSNLSVSGGGGVARLSIDIAATPPAIAADGKLNGVAFNRLPIGIAGFETLRGTGDATFDLTASGKTWLLLLGCLAKRHRQRPFHRRLD